MSESSLSKHARALRRKADPKAARALGKRGGVARWANVPEEVRIQMMRAAQAGYWQKLTPEERKAKMKLVSDALPKGAAMLAKFVANGHKRAASLTPERRREIAQLGGMAYRRNVALRGGRKSIHVEPSPITNHVFP